ncbi:MAG: ubiquinone/menaquinone biosynthesis methyltransferase [Bacteroidales bacterium]|jgi:demethylmenaquinone methyltransferase/2-methoxy-6-polyprenyl-1,4-benzoquinol methylase
MKGDKKNNCPLKEYYSGIYRRYDLINRLFTFGLDKKWRIETAKACLSCHPVRIIDLCSGTGDLALRIAGLSGAEHKIIAYDFNRDMLRLAEYKARNKELDNIDFVQGDVADIPYPDDHFDCIAIAFGFRNLVFDNPSSGKHMREINRILSPEGKFVILESSIPRNPIIRKIHKFYLSMILIPLGGLLSGNWKAYKYLARSSANFFNPDELAQLLTESGFNQVGTRNFFMGAANLFIAEKRKNNPGG